MVTTSYSFNPLNSDASVSSGSTDNTASLAISKKPRTPPSVFLKSTEHWIKVAVAITTKAIQIKSTRATPDAIRIQPSAPDHYMNLNKLLADMKLEFFTFRLPHEKPIQVVIRGLHPQATPDSIKSELLELGHPVISVYRWRETTLMTVNLKRCEEAKAKATRTNKTSSIRTGVSYAKALSGEPTNPPTTTTATPSTSSAPSHTTITGNITKAQIQPPKRTEAQQAAVLSKASNKATKTMHFRHKRGPTLPSHITELICKRKDARRQWQYVLAPQDYNSLTTKIRDALRSKKPSPTAIHGPNGLVYTAEANSEIIANSIELQCSPNYSHIDVDHVSRINKNTKRQQKIRCSLDISYTTSQQIQDIIKKTKIKKAAGPDGIPAKTLRPLPPCAHVAISNITNAVMRLRYFPAKWMKAIIITIPKADKDPKFFQNHRASSLLNLLAKVVKKVILNQLQAHTSRLGIKHSTVQQITRVAERHPLHLTQLVASYLDGRKFQVRLQGILSTERIITAGVPQGSLLSSHLYNIFSSDMPKPKSNQRLLAQYADDTAIIHRCQNSEIITRRLQETITSIEDWCNLWRIEVNPDKSTAILMTRRRLESHGQIRIFDRPIPWRDKALYLGATFDTNSILTNMSKTPATKPAPP
ncbi:hypothetical protein CBL_20081 [Carabus blaptoides fortunei]